MHPIPGDPIKIDSGSLSGTELGDGVKAYLGVPFAAPPVRDNRWRAPQPVEAWTGVYTADSMAPKCMQKMRGPSIAHYFAAGAISEDCLYLNVWAPTHAKAGDKLPVVVWIYGGAFSIGSASSPIYSGAPLARKGVIYVALNYRVGVFGFLALPALTSESEHHASGNWGLLDQVAGLKWVQRNIGAFGGDPANVTIIGQSAGSASLNYLQASPLAHGLFERILGMSGAVLGGGFGREMPSLKQGEETGAKLKSAMHAQSLADMRGMSPDQVMAIAEQSEIRMGPVVDGYFLPDTPLHIFQEKKQNDVTVVTGSTANDLGTEVPIAEANTLTEYRAIAKREYGAKASTFLSLWRADNNAQAAHEAKIISRNSGIALAARQWAKVQTATGRQPAYLYIFTYVPPYTPGVTFSDFDPTTAGSAHMADVGYWLGTYGEFNTFRKTQDLTSVDNKLSDEMQDVIVTYARTGNPNTAAVKFVKYSPDDERRTVFDDKVEVQKLNTRGMDFLLANPPPPSRPNPAPRTKY
jgi:para-nitrobenzyl esterase